MPTFSTQSRRSAEQVQRDAHRRGNARPDHHWTFDYFPPSPKPARAGHVPGYVLGESFPQRFVEIAQNPEVYAPIAQGAYPRFDHEYYELTDLFEAVLDARETFTFIEAGAGFGRWSVRATLAARRVGTIAPHVIMIEGDPVHAMWAREMMALNGIESFQLIQAAVAAQRGRALFIVDVPTGFFKPGERTNPAEWYGQSLADSAGLAASAFAECGETHEGRRVFSTAGWRAIEIDTVTLEDAIGDHPHIDLIDMDIQGAEAEVIAASMDLLARKVRRLCIETHGAEIECSLRKTLKRAGWISLRDLPMNTTTQTPFGPMTMPGGGLLSWLNPRMF